MSQRGLSFTDHASGASRALRMPDRDACLCVGGTACVY